MEAVASGVGLIVTVVETAVLVHPLEVTVRLYTPGKVISVGFCEEEVYPPGPVHAKVFVPVAVVLPFSCMGCGEQYGPVFVAVAVTCAGCVMETLF